MRCDYPMGFDEDHLDPADELFVQFFSPLDLELEPMLDSDFPVSEDNGDDGNTGLPLYYSEDSISLHSPGSHNSDSLGLEPCSLFPESSDEENFTEILNNASQNHEESSDIENDSTDVYELVDEITDVLSDQQSEGSSLTVNSQNSVDCNDISTVVSQETNDVGNIPSNDLSHSNQTSHFAEAAVQTDSSLNFVPFHTRKYMISPFSISEAVLPEGKSFDQYPEVFTLSKEIPPVIPSVSRFISEKGNNEKRTNVSEVEASVQTDSSPNPKVIHLRNSGRYVYSPISISDTIPREAKPFAIASEKFAPLEEIKPDSPVVERQSSSISVTENNEKHTSLSELDGVSDIENSVSSDTKSENIGFDENSHPEFVVVDADLSDEISIQQGENTCSDVTSGKSVPYLKRKSTSSVDDEIRNKVPKFSVSHGSNDSINEVSVNNYSNGSSSSTEIPILSDEDEIDIVSSPVNAEDVFIVMDDC